MIKTSKRALFLTFLVAAILIAGCSGPVNKVLGLFASKTPTPTVTPTPTMTPTATPQAPFMLNPCLYLEECPDAIGLEEILGRMASDVSVNEVQVPYQQDAQFYVGWISIDDATLQDNLKHIKWFFTIDGQDYFQESWLESGVTEDENDPTITYPGTWFGVAMSGWKSGESHNIRYGYVLDEAVNNGWDNFEAGTTLVYTWNITLVDLPTATPTATITLTPTVLPTNTKVPYVAPTATKGVELKKDIQIKVKNLCGEQHKVVFSGPLTIKYNVAPGQTETHEAAHGTYTWLIDGMISGGPQDLFTSIWTLTLCN